MHSGAILISKPIDITSSGVVTKLKWAMQNHGYMPKGFRIGHGGTLDPFATGVLVILFGEATKLADTYLQSVKAYDGLIKLGQQTDTGDPTGSVIEEKRVPSLSEHEWQTHAHAFSKMNYFQTPPMYSAKKKNGVALHTLAREGISIERDPILKKIFGFQIKLQSPNLLEFRADCESGTYIRVLAEDLAKRADTLAHLETLRRIRSSDCAIENCTALDETLAHLEAKRPLEALSSFRPIAEVATHLPEIELTEAQSSRLRQGSKSEIDGLKTHLARLQFESRFVLGKLHTQPVALFEKTNDINEFRLQRVFN